MLRAVDAEASRPQPRLRSRVRRRASQPGGARLRVRPRQRDQDQRGGVRVPAGLSRELLPVHGRVSADRRSGRAGGPAEDPAPERHRVAGARGMVASGAAAWPGIRDRVVDAAPVPVALRVGRSRDARPLAGATQPPAVG